MADDDGAPALPNPSPSELLPPLPTVAELLAMEARPIERAALVTRLGRLRGTLPSGHAALRRADLIEGRRIAERLFSGRRGAVKWLAERTGIDRGSVSRYTAVALGECST